MDIGNILIIVAILALVGTAIFYIIKGLSIFKKRTLGGFELDFYLAFMIIFVFVPLLLLIAPILSTVTHIDGVNNVIVKEETIVRKYIVFENDTVLISKEVLYEGQFYMDDSVDVKIKTEYSLYGARLYSIAKKE